MAAGEMSAKRRSVIELFVVAGGSVARRQLGSSSTGWPGLPASGNNSRKQ